MGRAKRIMAMVLACVLTFSSQPYTRYVYAEGIDETTVETLEIGEMPEESLDPAESGTTESVEETMPVTESGEIIEESLDNSIEEPLSEESEEALFGNGKSTDESEHSEESEEEVSLMLELVQEDPMVAKSGSKNMNWLQSVFAEGGFASSYALGTIETDNKKININYYAGLVFLSNISAEYYQDYEITCSFTENPDLTKSLTYDNEEYSFQGLGSVDYKFKGGVIFTEGAASRPWTINRSIFNYVYDSVTIPAISVIIGSNMSTAVLAENVYHDENTVETMEWKVTCEGIVGNEQNDLSETTYAFAGIIGNIADNAKVSLGFSYSHGKPYQANLKISGLPDMGAFCRTMGEKSKLTITDCEDNSDTNCLKIAVESTGGNAGGLVGSMGLEAVLSTSIQLKINSEIDGKKHAGGIVGSAENAVIPYVSVTLENGLSSSSNSVSVYGTVISRTADCGAGGFVGYYKASKPVTVNAESFGNIISDDTLVKLYGTYGSIYLGGLFGILHNSGSANEITITGTSISSIFGWQGNYGGVVGEYVSSALNNTLSITAESSVQPLKIIAKQSSNTNGCFGGIIGYVPEKYNDGDGEEHIPWENETYIQLKNISVETRQSNKVPYFGGIIARLSGGHLVDVENITISTYSLNRNNIYFDVDTKGGGLIGSMDGGALRLSGTTDLTNTKARYENLRYGQLVGQRDDGLVYATSGWAFKRSSVESAVSDIGDWGEVLRLDTENITEASNGLLRFDKSSHTVTVKEPGTTIENVSDFAALALTIQLYQSNGALILSSTTDNSTLLSDDYTVTSDIDLRGTGITGLMRDNGMKTGEEESTGFNGTLAGNNTDSVHKITLATGEVYGTRSGEAVTIQDLGSGQIYLHREIGLFSMLASDAKIENLEIAGNINFGNQGYDNINAQMTMVGAVAAQAESVVMNNVTVSTDFEFGNGSSSDSMRNIYAGGFVGRIYRDSNEETVTTNYVNCTFSGKMNSTCTAINQYIGGFVGYVWTTENTELIFTNCGLSGSISSAASIHARVGGLVAEITYTDNQNTFKSSINIDGLEVNGFSVQDTASETSGGLLGYLWWNTDVSMKGVTVQNSSVYAIGVFGGLVYQATGYWNVSGTGITFNSGNTFSGATNKQTQWIANNTDDINLVQVNSGLLVGLGQAQSVLRTYSSRNTEKYAERTTEQIISDMDVALYLEIGPDAVSIPQASNVQVTLKGGDYFDDLVGTSINSVYPNKNGVVSIATDSAHTGVDASGLNTWKNHCTVNENTTYTNANTRYYYNIDAIKDPNEENETINTAEELMRWSLYHYAASNICACFAKSVSDKITGTIDLRGYSYYPISCYASIDDVNIIFGNEQIETTEKANSNKQTTDNTQQHYLMQYGLFLSLENSGMTTKSASVSKLELSGTVGMDSTYSGALICGNFRGGRSASTVYTLRINGLTLDGIRFTNSLFDTSSPYAPILINTVGSYSTLNISGVRTTDAYNETSSSVMVATSLIGNVGSADDGAGISLIFADMGLDGRTAAGTQDSKYYTFNTIFTHATFLESFRYNTALDTCTGQYTFNHDTEYVTYGQEISNTENTAVSGRNNGNQYYYHDTDDFVTYGDVMAPNGFATGYRRYVYQSEGPEKKYFEIDINQRVLNLDIGCGTYGDPYIITDGGQLSALANCLDGQTNVGWSIVINSTVYENQNMKSGNHLFPDTEDKDVPISYLNSAWTDNTNSYETSEVVTYLRNAYYLIANDIVISSSYMGIGNSVVENGTSGAFSGVIIGKTANLNKDSDGKVIGYTLTDNAPKITITAPGDAVQQYGGLVRFGNGCVIKNLNIEYTGNFNVQSESAPASEAANEQIFFGGVIGYAIGGDNIIDTVGVDYSEATVTVNGTCNYLANVGGYVGLVGGNVLAGGGVVFRNMDASKKLSIVNNGSITTEVSEKNSYYYWNPFVGRVLDGYACYDSKNSVVNKSNESVYLINTDKNYSIPNLISESDCLSSSDRIQDSSTTTVTIHSAQQLWLLSAIVNSGSGGMNKEGYFGQNDSTLVCNAYSYGKVRTGLYSSVGVVVDGDELINDEACWGGIILANENKVPYLVRNFTGVLSDEFDMQRISSYHTKSTTVFTADCDMSEYGNGYRGIGTRYQDNTDTVIQRKSYCIYQVKCDDQTSPRTITVAIQNHEYENDFWYARQIGGLFNSIYHAYSNVSNVCDFNVSGLVTVDYIKTPANTEMAVCPNSVCIGGIAGCNTFYAQDSTNNPTTLKFQNIKLLNLTVGGDPKNTDYSGGTYCGGIIGANGSEINSNRKKLEINSCTYSGLNVRASNAAGGFVGESLRETTIQGTVQAENSYIRSDFYNVNSTNRGLTENNNQKLMFGAGGIIGYIRGTLNVTIETNGKTTITNCTVCGHTFDKVAADYGVGGICGTSSGNQTYKNVTITNCDIKGYDGQEYTKSYGSASVYETPFSAGFVGGFSGFSKSKLIFTNCDISESQILYGPVSGALSAIINGSDSSFTDCDVDTCTVFTQGTFTYQGPAEIGGFFGYVTQKTYVTDCNLTNSSVCGDGRVGGIIGWQNGNTLVLNNVEISSNKIVTTSPVKMQCWVNGDPDQGYAGDSPFKSNDVDNSGIAGAIAGRNNEIKGYQVLWRDNLIGYLCKGNGELDTELELSEVNDTTEKEIGLQTSTGYYPYSEIYGKGATDMNNVKSFTAGKIGVWTGNRGSNVRLVAVSVKGDYLPNQLIGSKYNNVMENNDYFIYSDYTHTADSTKGESTERTSSFLSKTPVSELTVKSSVSSQATKITGDGASFVTGTTAISNKIINDAVTYSPLNYSSVLDSETIVSQIFDISKISTYLSMERDSSYWASSKVEKPTNDFPVLVIDTNQQATVNSIINSYISILTNSNQTGNESTRNKKRYSKVVAKTYQWDGMDWVSIENQDENGSLIVSGTGTSTVFRVPSGKYDNDHGQITMLDVQYTNPNNANEVVFHLYIPVLVKKVLQYEFYVDVQQGSSYDVSKYTDDTYVLTSNGDKITALLTYNYLRTAEEWENSINGGENYLWTYSKNINIGTNALPSGTWVSLIDVADKNKFYSNTLSKEFSEAVSLTELTGWNSESDKANTYLCDLLPLSVKEDSTNGTMVKLADAAGATVRIGQEYYRLYDENIDGTSAKKYLVKVNEDNSMSVDADTKNVLGVTEQYFVTISTPADSSAVINNTISDSGLSGHLPTLNVNMTEPGHSKYTKRGYEDTYILGNFFQQNFGITTKDKEWLSSENKNFIDLTLTNEVTFSTSAAQTVFNNYSTNTHIYERFMIALERNGTDSVNIPAGTQISVNYKAGEITVLSKTYAVGSDVRFYNLDMGDIKDYIIAGNIITAEVKMIFTDSGLIEFPERDDETDISTGNVVSATSKLAFSTNQLSSSLMRASAIGTNRYYRKNMSVAKLNYYAGEYNLGDATGEVSQLGINAYVDGDSANLITYGIYNVQALTNAGKATHVKFSLRLARKDNEGIYITLSNISEYLSSVTIDGQDVSSSTYSLTEDWNKWNRNVDELIIVPIKLTVLTGWDGHDTGVYANYQVTLTAELGYTDDSGNWKTINGSTASKSIIYTNAKIRPGVIAKNLG